MSEGWRMFQILLLVTITGQDRRERPWWFAWTTRPRGLYWNCSNEYMWPERVNENLNLELIVAGFPGWHGITRREWPRRTKGDRSCCPTTNVFFCLFVFGAKVYSRAAVMVFFRAGLIKGMTLIKRRLNINRVRVEVDCKIVCRRNRQSLGSSNVLLSFFSNTWHGSIEPAVEVDWGWTHFCMSLYLTTGLFPSRENQGWEVYLGHEGCLA